MSSKSLMASVAVLLLAACPGPDGAVEVGCDEFAQAPEQTREVRMGVGGTLEVTLCSNASTGYGWGEPLVADPGTLEATGNEYVNPPGAAPGAPGTEVFTFVARREGTTTVRFAYGRLPGESLWELVLTVVVK